MNHQRQAYAATLYHTYSTQDAVHSDRHKRWRSIEPESAALIALFILAKQAKNILEIGTSGGYSTLWLADAAEQTGGHLTSLEIEEMRRLAALEHLHATGLRVCATLLCTDAGEFLARNRNAYDLILLDAERPAYPGYWPHLCDALPDKGATLIVDNVLSHADEVREFVATVQADSRWQSAVIPVGAGLLIAIRRA